MSRVFATNDTGLDFDPAKKYGELIPLIIGNVDIFHPERVKRTVEVGLRDFKVTEDYLLVCGASIVAAFALAHLALHAISTVKEGPVFNGGVPIKFLLYDSKRKEYFERIVEV